MSWTPKGELVTCWYCDKGLFKSRKEARRAARMRHPEKVLNAYECPLGTGWHYGNLPPGGRDQARRSRKAKVEEAEQLYDYFGSIQAKSRYQG